jgi:hypothetical protein
MLLCSIIIHIVALNLFMLRCSKHEKIQILDSQREQLDMQSYIQKREQEVRLTLVLQVFCKF